MDVPINAEVNCVDGPGGHSTHVIINSETGQVTHVVIETQAFPRIERVTPVDLIRESTPKRIELRLTRVELDELPKFVPAEYQQGGDERQHYEPGEWLFAPGADPAPAVMPRGHENGPDNEMALQRGAQVQATDGHVGSIIDLVVDPVNSQLTHVILRQGNVFNPRQVTIAADQIERITDDTIYLKLDKRAVDLLPDLPVRR